MNHLLIILILILSSACIYEAFMPLQTSIIRTTSTSTLPAHHDFDFLIAMARPVYEQAKVVPYEPGGIPFWVPPVFISLIIGTILLPQVARKAQLKKNTRTFEDLQNADISEEIKKDKM